MTKTVTLFALTILASAPITAQVPMPGQTCDPDRAASVASSANVTVKTKTTPFEISVNVKCNALGRPNGNLSINGLKVNGETGVTLNATSFVRLAGNSGTMPTAILTGACALTSPKTGQSDDCRYWISVTQISSATNALIGPQQLGIVAFKVTKSQGGVLSLGAGQVDPATGSITVSSNSLSY